MVEEIKVAIELRNRGDFDQSIAVLTQLLNNTTLAGMANLHIAWAYDAQGLESNAIPHYKMALDYKLGDEDRFDCLLGLASSLRCLGEFNDANEYFDMALKQYPNREEILPFYAMNLYNRGDSKSAVSVLLKLLTSGTSKECIQAYKSAIDLYAEDLDRTW
jgi:tetratricopeptide (TPR) repeat protein